MKQEANPGNQSFGPSRYVEINRDAFNDMKDCLRKAEAFLNAEHPLRKPSDEILQAQRLLMAAIAKAESLT